MTIFGNAVFKASRFKELDEKGDWKPVNGWAMQISAVPEHFVLFPENAKRRAVLFFYRWLKKRGHIN